MVNPFKEVNWNPGLPELRKFARSLVIGFPCVAVVLLLVGFLAGKGWNVSLALKVGGIGGAAGLLFLAIPFAARPFYAAWYFIACCIGLIVGNVLLSAVFYVFVTGIGLAMRACGRQSIRKTMDRQARTYWQDAKQPSDPQRYFHQF